MFIGLWLISQKSSVNHSAELFVIGEMSSVNHSAELFVIGEMSSVNHSAELLVIGQKSSDLYQMSSDLFASAFFQFKWSICFFISVLSVPDSPSLIVIKERLIQ